MKSIILLVVCVLLSSCEQGAQGPAGSQGITGATGAQGATGPTGANGFDGTKVTLIQFCPGVTPTYPQTFPESGICIEGQLYGVYSANGGFLTLLPPGEYSSNGVGASCTFTIGENCQVSN